MKKSLFKNIALLVLMMLLCNFIFPLYLSSAETNSLESFKLDEAIKKWIIDTDNNYIYILTKYTNKLLIVDTKYLKVINELDLESEATDIEMYNNKLYIALIDAEKIIEYDVKDKIITNEVIAKGKLKNIAVYNNKIYYGVWGDSWIYVYDISNKTNEKIIVDEYTSSSIYFSIDKSTGVLYFRLQLSPSYIYGVDTTNNRIIYKSKERTYGNELIADDGEVFSDNKKFNKALDYIIGEYTLERMPKYIVNVNDNYAFFRGGIFNRDNFTKVGNLPFETDYILADNNYVYFHNENDKTITKKEISSLVNENAKWSGSDLTKWVLDEEKGYIYGISLNENRLLFVNKDTLEIEDELIVSSAPSDIELDNGKLYISLSGSNKITVVDIETKKVYKEITIENRPYSLEKYGDRIYYVKKDNSRIYEYNLTNGVEKDFVAVSDTYKVFSYNNPEIMIDNNSGIMYLGSYGVFAIDLENYNLLDTTYYNGSYDFNGYQRQMIIDGNELYYSGFRIDKNNLLINKGNYEDEVVFVKNNYIFSNNIIYDKNNFLELGVLPFDSYMILVDSNNNIYYYDKENTAIKVSHLSSVTMDEPLNHYNSQAMLPLSMEIDDWVYNEDNNFIYAISSATGKLLFIDNNDFTVKSELYVGEIPSDIEVYNNKVYVSLYGEGKVAIIDDIISGEIRKISVNIKPYRIEVDDNNIYYTGRAANQKVCVYDIQKGISKNIVNLEYDFCDILFDVDNNTLYIGDDNNFGKKLVAISTEDYEILKEVNVPLMYRNSLKSVTDSSEKRLYKNDTKIYWGNFQVRISDMTIDWSYDSKPLHASETYMYSNKGIVAHEVYRQIVDFPFSPNLVLTNNIGEVFLYNKVKNLIFKYPSKHKIDLKVIDSLKIDINDKDQFVFSWDEVQNAIGYNLWYYTDKNWSMRKVNDLIKDNYYVFPRDFKGEYQEKVYFGITPTMEETSYEMLRKDMKEIVVDKFIPIMKGMNSDKFSTGNSIDLSFTSTSSRGGDGDGGSAVIYKINDNLFNHVIEKLDNAIEYIDLNSELEYDRFHINILGSSYDSLNKNAGDKRIRINTHRGKYIWPVSSINLSEVTVNPKTSSLDIEIKKERGENLGNIIYDLFNLDLNVKSSPIRFTIEVLTEEGRQTIKTLGKDYFQCWVPLEEEPDKSQTVGIFYDLKNKEYQHVPTTFHRDNNGKWWAIFNQNANGSYALVTHNKTFEDMKNHWAENDINLLASKFIIKGTTYDRFMPEEHITRAQYIALLIRALGLHSSNNHTGTLEDIHDDDWYSGVVKTAIDLGIIKGYEDGYFRPKKLISREEMSVLIVRVLNLLEHGKEEVNQDLLNSFNDSNEINSWAKNSAAIAVENGLIKGDEKGSFNPKDNTTRAQSGTVIKRLLEKVELIEE